MGNTYRRVVAGAVLLSAVAACGSTDDTQSQQAKATPTAEQSAAAQSSASPAPEPADPTSPAPSKTVALTADEKKRVEAARENGKKNSTEITHPLTAAAQSPDAPVNAKTYGSARKEGREIHVYSARRDLTGYRELRWVAAAGKKVGNANCTQTFKLANDKTPKVKPNLLICWRMSADRSVYTVSVDLDGKPSKKQSARMIDAEWRKLS
ncbi:hypothetical protein ACTI_04850 [Actinoplanes sp. OR16]|uniref:hypothetical protein n=1 Tax=Actinoplanes sp. OR16 TaxID=946334 RepID=UPI000F6DBD23|nr:hypothetical protein [Actinoplanes sp. OR16]BBH63800.1 hypothetical protein ACTI_04850 [Actinoplanes sp. OR16]